MIEFWFGVAVFWLGVATAILIHRNPYSFDEVRKAEQDDNGPWPKD